jgi:hypothetical protein
VKVPGGVPHEGYTDRLGVRWSDASDATMQGRSPLVRLRYRWLVIQRSSRLYSNTHADVAQSWSSNLMVMGYVRGRIKIAVVAL